MLNGDGRDARKHLAGCVFQRREISDDEDFGMIGKAEIGIDQHASSAIDRNLADSWADRMVEIAAKGRKTKTVEARLGTSINLGEIRL